MLENNIIKPDFIIAGAQKSATAWLWKKLDQHPETSLPQIKENHFFGSSEIYSKGKNWYYRHFEKVSPLKVTGEKSTSYFFDRVPYFYNKSHEIEYDDSLPSIPELISSELPEVKIIILLRDPVVRAISSYMHYLKRAELSPFKGLKVTALKGPKRRILEYGYYGQYLSVWKKYIPDNRLRIFIYEEDVRDNPRSTLHDIYDYLDLDPNFEPESPGEIVHKSWSWTRIVFKYLSRKYHLPIIRGPIARLLDRFDFLGRYAVSEEDIEFLRSVYLPQKEELCSLLGRNLDCWKYGVK